MANLDGYKTSTLVISFEIDFKKISEGWTRDKSHNPNLRKAWDQ